MEAEKEKISIIRLKNKVKCCRTQSRDKPEKRIAQPGEKNQVRGFDQGHQVEKIIGAADAAGELIFLVKWHLYKKYEFSCGVSGSNIFFRLETPIKTPDPIFLPG